MKRLWMSTGIVVLCLPMLFAIWLVLATQWPKMDALTMKMPMFLRTTVANVVAQSNHGGFDRARRLDPDVKKYETIGGLNLDVSPDDVTQPNQQVNSPKAKELDKQGRDREAAGDECGAVTYYTLADSNEAQSDSVYRYAHDKGHAALLCGDMGAAQVALEKAIKKEDETLRFSRGDQDDLQNTLLQDRERLIVVYDDVKEPGMARDVCTTTHPDWKSCECKLKGKAVACAEGH